MGDSEQNDPLPSLVAGLDQAIAAVPYVARYAWSLYSNFLEVGFTAEQALTLTIDRLNLATNDDE